ncbi:hypothetical protein ACE2AJ_18315 [Aquihabitans daechungensis]|uniref:hypothetical protein n=1 Tax=Aquihabitans daechungensis TaxID=1052257 RepID=UPI003BA23919
MSYDRPPDGISGTDLGPDPAAPSIPVPPGPLAPEAAPPVAIPPASDARVPVVSMVDAAVADEARRKRKSMIIAACVLIDVVVVGLIVLFVLT